MPRTSSPIAKLTRPKIFGIVPRDRLFARLDEQRNRPVVWVVGPPGAGKTTLVVTHLQARKVSCIWYQVDRGDADPAAFVYYLGQAAQRVAPRKRESLPLLTPECLPVAAFTRRWFRELFARLPRPAALVLDNYQEVPDASAFH